MKVRTRHHGHPTGARHVAQRHQVAGSEDCLHVRRTCGLFKRGDLVIEGLPLAVEDVRAGDDDVDFLRAGFDAAVNLFDALGQRRKACRESCGNSGDGNAGAFERSNSRLNKRVVDADGADGEMQVLNTEAFNNVTLERVARLGAESADAVGRVVAAQGGQVHAGDGAKQPCCLRFLLYGAPRNMSRRAPLNSAGVDAYALDPVQIEGNAPVGFEGAPIQDDGDGLDSMRRGAGRIVIRGDGLEGHGETPQQR